MSEPLDHFIQRIQEIQLTYIGAKLNPTMLDTLRCQVRKALQDLFKSLSLPLDDDEISRGVVISADSQEADAVIIGFAESLMEKVGLKPPDSNHRANNRLN